MWVGYSDNELGRRAAAAWNQGVAFRSRHSQKCILRAGRKDGAASWPFNRERVGGNSPPNNRPLSSKLKPFLWAHLGALAVPDCFSVIPRILADVGVSQPPGPPLTHRNAAHNQEGPEGAAPVGCNCLVGPAWTKLDSYPPFRPPGLDLWVTTDAAGCQRVRDY